MAGFSTTIYNAVFRRTSTFALAIIIGGIVFERSYDQATTAMYESINKGKLWKDIKHKYE